MGLGMRFSGLVARLCNPKQNGGRVWKNAYHPCTSKCPPHLGNKGK
ncbi:uncharacterized protein G2W53_024035 [Senna tora]|uniref:Uncharacterized protein n=1 Tax=Senna tora TaxID=362788 RepID=A0A834TB23_9FABA|nr:uncharacterized protein G2W53_024035 [Senna tora]